GATVTDASTLGLRLATAPTQVEYQLGAFGNAGGAPALLPGPDDPSTGPAFLIPANKSGHTETMLFEYPSNIAPLAIMTAYPHIQYVGTKLTLKVFHPDGSEECLSNVEQWNFDWQRQYAVDAPLEQLPVVGPGDKVEIKCTYDNTMNNPFVVRSLHDQGLDA